jgi:hypothetical protein
MTAFVFATSFIDNNPSRYQGWIDYYTEFFYDMDVQLMLFNDGPIETQLSGEVEQKALLPHLGRQHVWEFPGWKRSFYYGLKTARERGVKYIAHIESDCFIKISGREEFLHYLYQPGYYTPFCKAYNFPETALQILNEDWVTNFYLDKYSYEANWHERVNFELFVTENLHPKIILNGDRYEGNRDRIKPEYNYISGCTAQEFLDL